MFTFLTTTILESIALSLNFYLLTDNKNVKKSILLFLCLLINAFGFIYFYLAGTSSLIQLFIFFCFSYRNYSKEISLLIINSLLPIINFALSFLFSQSLFSSNLIAISLSATFIGCLLSITEKKYLLSFILKHKYYATYVYIMLYIYLYRFAFINDLHNYLNTSISTSSFFIISAIVSLALLSLFFSLISLKHERQTIRLEALERQRQQDIAYANQSNKTYQELRKFRHDYINMLISTQHYIETADLEGLKAYFQKLSKENNFMTFEQIDASGQLSNLQNLEIQSLVWTKCLYAKSLGIDVQIIVNQNFTLPDSLTIGFVRMLGICLDNAIEAIENTENPWIKIEFIKYPEDLLIMVSNNTEEVVDVELIKEVGYTTKAKGEGLGIPNIVEISQRLGINHDIEFDNYVFTQVFHIDRKKGVDKE